MERTILHCDCNSFFASVECLFNPELRKVPMAVCGSSHSRHGIILAKNEIAKKFDIKTAETVWQAKKKCPDLVLVPPRHEEYSKYCTLLNEIYLQYTDLVEPFGVDESWLDVTASKELFGDGKKIADELRQKIKIELGLTISVGVSFNKIFAKIGSDYKKPDATTVITRSNYKEIVYPLHVSDMLFVGRETTETLKKFGVFTIGQLAAFDKTVLEKTIGKAGAIIYEYACANDQEIVKKITENNEVKSIGNGMTYKRDLIGYDDIKLGIVALSESVAMRLRKKKLFCTTLQISIKSPTFKTLSKQKQIPNTCLAKEIIENAMNIISSCWNLSQPIRALTITAINLVTEDSPLQYSLFEEKKSFDSEKQLKLEKSLDKIRDKYGKTAISHGGIINNDIGINNNDEK